MYDQDLQVYESDYRFVIELDNCLHVQWLPDRK